MPRPLLLLLLLALPPLTVAATPRIVVSLPPLHSLVVGVTGGEAETHLLLRGGASPHSFSLQPSDARALARADLVVGADPELERFLERALASLATESEVIWLTAMPGVHRLESRAGGIWAGHHDHEDTAHGNADEHAADETHDHDEYESLDAHAWLDPRNAIALTRRVADTLAAADPEREAFYRANAARRIERLQTLDRELAERLASARGLPYLVFHDAYQYFEARYGLSPVGALAVDPERPPGARRLAELHDRIEETGARCLFAEPQFEPKIVRVIRQATGVRTAMLDPLGAALEPGPELYEALLRKLAADLKACLEG